MPMAAFSWDRLFRTCIQLSASDILFVAGRPPYLRLPRGLYALDLAPLSAEEIGALLRELAPLPESPSRSGYYNFEASYQDECHFRVASFGLPAPHFTILMRTAD